VTFLAADLEIILRSKDVVYQREAIRIPKFARAILAETANKSGKSRHALRISFAYQQLLGLAGKKRLSPYHKAEHFQRENTPSHIRPDVNPVPRMLMGFVIAPR
jgi:hypothetical protein